MVSDTAAFDSARLIGTTLDAAGADGAGDVSVGGGDDGGDGGVGGGVDGGSGDGSCGNESTISIVTPTGSGGSDARIAAMASSIRSRSAMLTSPPLASRVVMLSCATINNPYRRVCQLPRGNRSSFDAAFLARLNRSAPALRFLLKTELL
ncbi:MAG: hypothetical protein WAK04_08430 [Xanthobacteraceae bacterium]